MTGAREGGGRSGEAVERRDFRSAAERRVRKAWSEGAGPGLRLAAGLFVLAARARDLAFEAGLVRPREAGVPVLSVGGLTVGGSGKTPVAARAARWARSDGMRPTVLTRGFGDELALHRWLNPDVPVVGAEERVLGARRAAARGAGLVILDDGFQHRRLTRDLDWVVVDEAGLARAWTCLPAGPAREPWSSLSRADAVILTRRTGLSGSGAGSDGSPDGSSGIPERVRRQFPSAAVARCELRPGALEPVNAPSSEMEEPSPRVTFASVMKGEDVLHALRRRRPEIAYEFLFPDHHRPSDARLEEMIELAGEGGIAGTRKDVVKVQERVGDRTPLWSVGEDLAWTSGRSLLKRQLRELAAWT